MAALSSSTCCLLRCQPSALCITEKATPFCSSQPNLFSQWSLNWLRDMYVCTCACLCVCRPYGMVMRVHPYKWLHKSKEEAINQISLLHSDQSGQTSGCSPPGTVLTPMELLLQMSVLMRCLLSFWYIRQLSTTCELGNKHLEIGTLNCSHNEVCIHWITGSWCFLIINFCTDAWFEWIYCFCVFVCWVLFLFILFVCFSLLSVVNLCLLLQSLLATVIARLQKKHTFFQLCFLVWSVMLEVQRHSIFPAWRAAHRP